MLHINRSDGQRQTNQALQNRMKYQKGTLFIVILVLSQDF